ncbi:MAG: hypothetical protein KatS3mg121_1108 [Gammaproteobacteria bacterium]|nr:MAG: hypothetical protein KatS3mg121_1108 [Gammaproteobacteria bacterium]
MFRVFDPRFDEPALEARFRRFLDRVRQEAWPAGLGAFVILAAALALAADRAGAAQSAVEYLILGTAALGAFSLGRRLPALRRPAPAGAVAVALAAGAVVLGLRDAAGHGVLPAVLAPLWLAVFAPLPPARLRVVLAATAVAAGAAAAVGTAAGGAAAAAALFALLVSCIGERQLRLCLLEPPLADVPQLAESAVGLGGWLRHWRAVTAAAGRGEEVMQTALLDALLDHLRADSAVLGRACSGARMAAWLSRPGGEDGERSIKLLWSAERLARLAAARRPLAEPAAPDLLPGSGGRVYRLDLPFFKSGVLDGVVTVLRRDRAFGAEECEAAAALLWQALLVLRRATPTPAPSRPVPRAAARSARPGARR